MRVWFKRIHSNGIYGLDDGTSAKTKAEVHMRMKKKKRWLVIGCKEGKGILSYGIYGSDDGTTVGNKAELHIRRKRRVIGFCYF